MYFFAILFFRFFLCRKSERSTLGWATYFCFTVVCVGKVFEIVVVVVVVRKNVRWCGFYKPTSQHGKVRVRLLADPVAPAPPEAPPTVAPPTASCCTT